MNFVYDKLYKKLQDKNNIRTSNVEVSVSEFKELANKFRISTKDAVDVMCDMMDKGYKMKVKRYR